MPNGSNIFQMAIEYTNFFHSKDLQNLPNFGFLVRKYTIWQLCSRASRQEAGRPLLLPQFWRVAKSSKKTRRQWTIVSFLLQAKMKNGNHKVSQPLLREVRRKMATFAV
jgi:hypothetical protein